MSSPIIELNINVKAQNFFRHLANKVKDQEVITPLEFPSIFPNVNWVVNFLSSISTPNINLFKPNELSYLYRYVKFISNFRGAGWYFSFLFKF